MPRTRVFISHSARDGRAADVREAIGRRLQEDPQYAVLMDDLKLEPGDAWRARINLWIGSCDAAIVIISPAALVSSYVAYELSVLGYRRQCDAKFRVIPVYVDVTSQQVNDSILKPTMAGEWSSVHGSAADVAAQVVRKLDGVVPADARPIEQMARVLDAHLPTDDVYLDDAAAALGIELQWDAGHSTRFCLALKILGAGMTDVCAQALRRLRKQPKFQENLAKVIELVSAAWVDLKADELPALMKNPKPPALALNAARIETVKMYLCSARHRVQPTMSYILTAESNTVIEERRDEEQHVEELAGAVRKVLYAKLEVAGDDALKKALVKYAMKLGEPVVVAIPAAAVNASIIARLRMKFEHVTFFVLAGGKQNLASIDHPAIHVIRPPLGEEDERKCHAQFDEFSDLVKLPLGD